MKSSPFFFLLYYCIAQYNKERNFQEEYAFKSAAALTIKAYADILKDDKNKDELVLKAVYGIYRSPVYTKLKATKEINSTLDMFAEVLKKNDRIFYEKIIRHIVAPCQKLDSCGLLNGGAFNKH